MLLRSGKVTLENPTLPKQHPEAETASEPGMMLSTRKDSTPREGKQEFTSVSPGGRDLEEAEAASCCSPSPPPVPSVCDYAIRTGRPLTDKEMEFFLQLEDRRAQREAEDRRAQREAEDRRAREAEDRRAQLEAERIQQEVKLAEIAAGTRRAELEAQVALEKARQPDTSGTPPNTPTSIIIEPPRKLPMYQVGDNVEDFFLNFERACQGYNIPPDQYMRELRSQIAGPLLGVAADLPGDMANDYELFKQEARLRMGLTPEQARCRFRASKWTPNTPFPEHASRVLKNWETWLSGEQAHTREEISLLMQMEQFLEGVPGEIRGYILDGKPKNLREAAVLGARWMELRGHSSLESSLRGPINTWGSPRSPSRRDGPYIHPGRPQISPRSSIPSAGSPSRSNDTAVRRCFKCNGLGHVKADCPQSTNRLQLITPGLPQGASGPDASLIPLERRETVRVGGREVIAWRDTGAQVSVIHHALVDPKAIDPETLVTIQPFKADPFDLPTAKLPVQYKGWSGTWTFAVYDDYPIPMLVGEDLAKHVKQAKRVGVLTRSEAMQAVHPDTPNPAVIANRCNQADTLIQPQDMYEVCEGDECESGKLSVAGQSYGEPGKSFPQCLPEGESCVSVSEVSAYLPGVSEKRLESDFWSDFWALPALFRERVPLVQSGVAGQSGSLVGEKDQILEGVQCEQPLCVEPGSLVAEEGGMHVGEGFLPSSLSTGGACQPGLAEESAVGPDLALGAAEAQKGEGEVSDLSPEESVCFPEGGLCEDLPVQGIEGSQEELVVVQQGDAAVEPGEDELLLAESHKEEDPYGEAGQQVAVPEGGKSDLGIERSCEEQRNSIAIVSRGATPSQAYVCVGGSSQPKPTGHGGGKRIVFAQEGCNFLNVKNQNCQCTLGVDLFLLLMLTCITTVLLLLRMVTMSTMHDFVPKPWKLLQDVPKDTLDVQKLWDPGISLLILVISVEASHLRRDIPKLICCMGRETEARQHFVQRDPCKVSNESLFTVDSMYETCVQV
ncbi:uncharacterized protein LOC142829545 isoform X2 [Pelodiscus sinensis]|uniref:uncharacterized protein LOC142829545 isoform X2 n=1 Tax=Pelodiscus sinensis TaxID=13735 RepID=UPI003F6C7128